MTPRECARLQCLGKLPYLPYSDVKAFKALGNAVNAEVVKMVADSLIPKTNSSQLLCRPIGEVQPSNYVPEELVEV